MSALPSHEESSIAEDLLQQYAAVSGAFDEMQTAQANPRPHWRPLLKSLQRLGRHELASRWENGRRIMREHGVTYNVYGDPQGMDRPWALDLVPLLITANEWASVEKALIQRAQLLNLVLADIYSGSQRLIRDGFLPPELVYANPGFLRPCRGIPAPKNIYLHLHACDLGRAADGQWWVLADRTQAPSGAGYAWENRTVISRILPDEIRDGNVQRLAGFFRLQREMLFQFAPQASTSPSVVLLTPGPHNETYFEHAYLARHLAFPLVEGADLTVRDRRVFLKTLEGLEPVDVILRRVDDSFCDPLELRSDSFLGVSGLVEATRAGQVVVANALGTGLMESPAFLAFLPAVCQHLLGEELLMPSVATWWCGQADALRYVLEHLDQLVVKLAFGPGRERWFGGNMSAAERTQLIETLRARPRDFVGQERVALSRAPIWIDSHFEARPIVLRAYTASGGDSVAVLPGGLTRVSKTEEDPVVSMQSGGGSKDTWILGNGAPGRTDSARVIAGPRVAERALAGVPSRAADHLFWLGRYTERLEQRLRVLRCVLGRIAEEGGGPVSRDLVALAELMAQLELLSTPLGPTFSRASLQQQVLQLVFKAELTGSVRELLGRIRFIASTVRDRFSGDTWRILGRLEADGRARPGRLPMANATALIHNLVFDLAAFNGMEMENMTRGRAWRFLDLGRRLERGLCVVNLVRAAAGVRTAATSVLEPLLEIADSVMTYRRRYFVEPRWHGVLELLLREDSNPRSLAFQINGLRGHIHALIVDPRAANPEIEMERIETLTGILGSAELIKMAAEHRQGRSESLQEWLIELGQSLGALSDNVTSRYFSHTLPRVN